MSVPAACVLKLAFLLYLGYIITSLTLCNHQQTQLETQYLTRLRLHIVICGSGYKAGNWNHRCITMKVFYIILAVATAFPLETRGIFSTLGSLLSGNGNSNSAGIGNTAIGNKILSGNGNGNSAGINIYLPGSETVSASTSHGSSLPVQETSPAIQNCKRGFYNTMASIFSGNGNGNSAGNCNSAIGNIVLSENGNGNTAGINIHRRDAAAEPKGKHLYVRK